MKTALLGLDAGQSSLELYRELLTRLPSYTEVLLLLPRNRVDAVTRELEGIPNHGRIQLTPFDGDPADHGILHFINQAGRQLTRETITSALPLQFGTIWVQDLVKPVITTGGDRRLIAAPVHLCLWTEDAASLSNPVSDNRYVSTLSPLGLDVQRIPAVFKGGNILTARAGNKVYAFCGSDIRIETREVRQSFPALAAADSLLPEVISRALGVDRAIFVGGNRAQPRRMYHLDQAMLPLSDGVVAVTRITGEAPAEAKAKTAIETADGFLEELRVTLKRLGFTIVDLDTPVTEVLRSNFYVNAIPFTHAVTGQRTLLLPVFGGPGEPDVLRANTRRLSELGYTVIPVPCRAGKLKGGIHCLINVVE